MHIVLPAIREHANCALLSLALLIVPIGLVEAAPPSSRAIGPVVRIEDVDRFYALYDASKGHPTIDELQSNYLDQGSAGLHAFAKARRITGASIEAAIDKTPTLYTEARRCAVILPRARERLALAMRHLAQLYPEARFPPITIAVGHGRPVGAADLEDGVMIGLEALCAVKYFDPDVEDRFVHVIAHEYIHAQQSGAVADIDHPTVLQLALVEGGAEFIGEKISGGVGNPGVWTEAKGHEREIETAFVPDEDKTDLSNWAFNGTLDKQGDLAYWVGYRIVKAYYERASDKHAAIRDILHIADAKAFLAESGWQPGIDPLSGRAE